MGVIKPDGLPIRFLSKVCDLIFLNLFFVLSCTTVVFFGAGLTALYAVTMKMVQGREYRVCKDFFRVVKNNFISSANAVPLLFLDGALMAYLRYVLYADTLLILPEFFILLVIISLLFTAVLSWLFPLLSCFDNTFPHHLANAVKLALAHLPVTCLMTLVNLLPILLSLLFPALLGQIAAFWLFIGMAAGAFVNSFYLSRIFGEKGG